MPEDMYGILVNVTDLDNALTATASAIREKTGDSSSINFDLEGGTGFRNAINNIPTITEITVSSTGDVTQALDAGKIYHFTGSLTSLTITFNATNSVAQYHFDFTEGSTAFDPTLPSGVKLPDSHTWEADTRYEVDILNNYAVVVGWVVS